MKTKHYSDYAKLLGATLVTGSVIGFAAGIIFTAWSASNLVSTDKIIEEAAK